MESAINYLEESIKKVDSQLDDLIWKIDVFDKEVASSTTSYNESEKPSILYLIDDVFLIKEEYEPLTRKMFALREMQKVERSTLRNKMLKIRYRINALRLRCNHLQGRTEAFHK